MIDPDRSESVYDPEKGAVEIRVFSVRDVCCPLLVVLGVGHGLYVFAYGDAAISFDGFARDEHDAKKFAESLLHYLATDVTEERTKIGDAWQGFDTLILPVSARGCFMTLHRR